jgi:hypothetical protein
VIDFLTALLGNWAIWKTRDPSPKTTRWVAQIIVGICALAVVAFLVAVVMVLTGR